MIEMTDIHKSYRNVAAVCGVSFSVGSGEILGLLGPNGAGKTTILKILCGFHFPDSGTARIGSFDVVDFPLEAKRRLGYLPENAPLYRDLTVMEHLRFICDARLIPNSSRASCCAAAIESCGLTEVINRPVGELSKGFRQRTGLAQAILHNPDILILDEPTSGLDPNQILEIRRLIRTLGEEKTVILSTHILREVEALCDRVLILNEGRVAAEGTTAQISAEFSGAERWSVSLIVPDGTDVSVFGSVPLVSQVEAVSIGKLADRTRISAELSMTRSAGTQGGGEILFDWAVQRGFKLISLAAVHHSLEDLFVRLTGSASVEERV
jgi:ABC-2 type transport system ATP-binding protein